MYKYIDHLKIAAVGLAAAVVFALPSHEMADGLQAAKECLLFPQFTQAAASDRSAPMDGGEIVCAFRIAEIFEGLFD